MEDNAQMSSKPNTEVHKTKRLANMELLRIIAMMMVVTLHYLGKGGLLPDLFAGTDAVGYVAWIMESLSIVAVNVYVLISGYFLVNAEFKVKRIVSLLTQVLFYTILVPLVCMAVGLIGKEDITIYQIISRIFPVQMEHYWFITAYVLMYILAPILALGIKAMKQVQLKITIITLLLFLSIGKSILPVALEIDNRGYDCLWFLCVFLIAAYIRLYGLKFFDSKGKSFAAYLVLVTCIFGWNLIINLIYQKTGSLEYWLGYTYDYNHILNIGAAIALFYVLLHISIFDGWFARLICRISPYTLGVYLLHEELTIRYQWPKWLGAGSIQNPVLFVLHTFCIVVLVFAIGCLVDFLRSLLFKGVTALYKKAAKK